jgi:hypothetical protein
LKDVAFPLQEDKAFDGIISCLTRKHRGNVHHKGIMTIDSKSVDDDDPEYAPANVADLISEFDFNSKSGQSQWICWNFHEMRVRPTHYTITSGYLKWWVVESSLDGKTWAEIDRKRKNMDLWEDLDSAASFAVAKSTECRFVRLTQTGKNDGANDHLIISAVEFFGTLLE